MVTLYKKVSLVNYSS